MYLFKNNIFIFTRFSELNIRLKIVTKACLNEFKK